MSKAMKTKRTSTEDYYQKWTEVKIEIERLRNYYEVDFNKAFTRVRELKEMANFYWDQYEKSRSIEPSRLSPEGQALYQVWLNLRDIAKDIQSQYEAASDEPSRERLKDILGRVRDRADDLWFDLQKIS